MRDIFSRAPFAKLLIPVFLAIISSTYCFNNCYPKVVAAVGICLILHSIFISQQKNYSLRWVFGLGLHLIIFAISTFSLQHRLNISKFDFENASSNYIGTVFDIPQEKPKSIACNIYTTHPIKKKIVVYLQKDHNAQSLKPGDEIVFYSKIEPFKNFGNPDDFNFEKFMANKGFAGSTYISANDWQKTGEHNKTLRTISLHSRLEALDIFKKFELNHDAYSFISALILGHKDELSNDVKEAFRASGTSHVLAVSGLHVGIIYAVLALLLSFLGRNRRQIVVKQILIVAALWCYALLTGLSPSVIRAAIMLSIICISVMLDKKVYTYNTVAAAAFLILIINPLQFFDVGFQMSFIAVLSIVYFNPAINGILKPKRKIPQYLWSIFTVSLAAQMGVFPIALYYFGTFPTYFFIANMIIVPMIGLIIYTSIGLATITMIMAEGGALFIHIFSICKTFLNFIIELTLKVVYKIETLPYSQISDLYLSSLQTIILMSMIYFGVKYIKNKSPKSIIASGSCFLFLSLLIIAPKFSKNNDHLIIFNTPNKRDIALFIDNKRVYFNVPDNGYISHHNKKILSLTQNKTDNLKVKERIELDILVLSYDNTFSIHKLQQIFTFNQLIIDSSVSQKTRNRWKRECDNLGIGLHDVSKDGAFFIKI